MTTPAPEPVTRARHFAARHGFEAATALAAVLVAAAAAWPVLDKAPLVPDDYRYLEQVRQLRAGGAASASLFVVENAWDHLWWVDAGAPVRFFRPSVVMTYALDVLVWGAAFARGLFVTNLLLHLLCTALVFALARALALGRPGTLAATLLFAGFACHGEVLTYVAGRTDSLAAACFLGALLLHLRPSRGRWLAPAGASALFLVGVLTKELVVALPLVCLVHDAVVATPGARATLRDRAGFYGGYALASVLWLAGRAAALDSGTSWVFPYLVHPLAPGFPDHLATALRSYGENLFLGTHSPPFLQRAELSGATSPAGGWLALGALGTLAASLAHRQVRSRALLLGALGVLAWAPTSVVYVSERYLYLPSAALALAAGLAVTRWSLHAWQRALAAAVVLGWAGHQAWALRREAVTFSTNPTEPAILEALMGKLSPRLAPGSSVLLLDFPLSWIAAQFVEPTLRFQLQDPSLRVSVLTHYPYAEYDLPSLTRSGPRSFVAARQRGGSLTGRLDAGDHFRRTPCQPGTVVHRNSLGFDVTVLRGSGEACNDIEVRLPGALEDTVLLWYAPPRGPEGRISGRVEQGQFMVLKAPSP